MNKFGLLADEADLQRSLDSTLEFLSQRYREERHQIATTIVSSSDSYQGLHIEAMVGRASVCAESIALGNALIAGEADMQYFISVRLPKPGETQIARVVPPCGLCRELLLDYGPNILAAITVDGLVTRTPLAALLPYKYVGTKWGHEASQRADVG